MVQYYLDEQRGDSVLCYLHFSQVVIPLSDSGLLQMLQIFVNILIK